MSPFSSANGALRPSLLARRIMVTPRRGAFRMSEE
jgi:hypothetical protein